MGLVKSDDAIHRFWLTRDGNARKRLEAMCELREWIDSLSPLKQSFRKKELPGDHDHRFWNREMMYMVDSWEMPPVIGGADGRWMNPNYKERRDYPESYAICDCGAVLTRAWADGRNRFNEEHDHADDCALYDRLRARARLHEGRRDILIQGLRLGLSGRQMAPRLGLHYKGIGSVANQLAIDIEAEKQFFRELAGRTYVEFQREGISALLIADAYGTSTKTMRERAAENTEYRYFEQNKRWMSPIGAATMQNTQETSTDD